MAAAFACLCRKIPTDAPLIPTNESLSGIVARQVAVFDETPHGSPLDGFHFGEMPRAASS